MTSPRKRSCCDLLIAFANAILPKQCLKCANRSLPIHRAGTGSFCDGCFRTTNGEKVYRCGKCDVYICFFCCPETFEDVIIESCCEDRCLPVLTCDVRPVMGLVNFFQTRSSEKRFLQYFASETPYYYYGCGMQRDTGWGCAYRCFQMMIASIQSTAKIPSIVEIQRVLVKLDVFQKVDIFSQKWIDPVITSVLLSKAPQHFLKKKDIIIRTHSERVTRSVKNRKRFVCNLMRHFDEEKGGMKTPVMFDDDTYAYLITGIRIDRVSELIEVLVFDPHVLITRGPRRKANGVKLRDFLDDDDDDDDDEEGKCLVCTSPIKPQGTARWIPLTNILFFREGDDLKEGKKVWMSCFFAVGEDSSLDYLDV